MATHTRSDEPLAVGAILRQARKRQGIDIGTVEERTKIRAKYLRALEEEDWDVLPGPAYARGFIRAYAELLGLDTEVLVEEFRRGHEGRSTTTYDLAEPVLRGRLPDEGPKAPIARRVIIGAIVTGVAFVLLVLGLTAGDDEEPKQRGAKGERQERGERNKADGGGGSAATRAPEKLREVTVKLVARSDVQACLVDDHGQVLVPDQLLTAGVEDGPYVSKRFKLELDPAAARILVNGETARTPPSAEPAAYTVTSEGVRPNRYTGRLCP
ncbi:MAG TPA: helix-turn-helix domain-containing protein [Solirubrobacterales bacterium]|nr:helix-turn-helix domain-containing protein [Solirubrobacterales bacterium]